MIRIFIIIQSIQSSDYKTSFIKNKIDQNNVSIIDGQYLDELKEMQFKIDENIYNKLIFRRFPNKQPLFLIDEALGNEYNELSKVPQNYVLKQLDEQFKKICLNINTLVLMEQIEIKTNLHSSKDKKLKWSIMKIPKDQSFKIQAHPVLEFIQVIKGSLKETRVINYVADVSHLREGDSGPDLTDKIHLEQKMNTTEKGFWLVNEIGSINQSYTDEETWILVLWSGQHLDIESEMLPSNHQFKVHQDLNNYEINQTIIQQ